MTAIKSSTASFADKDIEKMMCKMVKILELTGTIHFKVKGWRTNVMI